MGDTIKPAIMNLPDKPDSSSSSGTDNGNIASRLDDRCKEMSAAPPLQSPPPPASWPSSSSPLLPRRSYQHATATPSAMASSHAMSEGFNEEMEVLVPAREAKFFVRVAGRELAAANGVAVVLHGVRVESLTIVGDKSERQKPMDGRKTWGRSCGSTFVSRAHSHLF